jgi:hypothetical protein
MVHHSIHQFVHSAITPDPAYGLLLTKFKLRHNLGFMSGSFGQASFPFDSLFSEETYGGG